MKTIWHGLAESRLTISGVVCLMAALTFNNWLLGLLLNRRLLFSGGSVSELSVRGQPFAHVFQGLDMVSGALFVTFALLVRKSLGKTGASFKMLIYGTLIFGAANIIDAFFTLPCSETLDKNCYVPLHINWSHFSFPSHGYSSVIIAILYFMLPLVGLFYARNHKKPLFYKISLFTLIVAILSLISATWQYLDLHSFTVNASGWAQGIQMLIMAAWFFGWCLALLAPKRARVD